nr:hypothetical protein [Rubritalea profundi]
MNNSTFIIHNSAFACLRATHRLATGVGIPFETKMTEMSQTLYQQMEQASKLDIAIRKNLEGLGYGK